MPSRDVDIRLIAKDQTSSVLKAIGREAQTTGKQLEQAGKQGARGMKEAKDAGRDLAIGVGALAGVFTLAARSQQNAEQASRTLTRQYGDEAAGLRDLADEIQRTTTFSNDQAVQAANTFGTLRREYGLTVEQIGTLIQVSADLAAAQGITLDDAAQRVGAAMRGEAESAEVLGLVLNDASLGIDRMSTSTSNAEKTQIRFNALLDQSAFAQGAAAEKADTTAGAVQQLGNRVQDTAQDFAAWTGPIGESTAALSDFVLQAGLATTGVVALAKGMVAVGGAAAGTAAGAAAVAGLGGAVVTLGVAAAAAIGPVGALTYLIVTATDAQEAATKESEKARDRLNEVGLSADETAIRLFGLIRATEGLGVATVQLEDGTFAVQDLNDQFDKLLALNPENLATLFAVLSDLEFDFARPAADDVAHLIDTIHTLYTMQQQEARNLNAELAETVPIINDVNRAFQDFGRQSTSILGDLADSVRDAGAALGTAAAEQGTGDKIASWLGLPADWKARLKDMQAERQQAIAPPLVSGAKEVTAAIIPAPMMATPDPMAISFFTDLEIAYANVGRGALTAAEALGVFKGAQDGLLGSQDAYNQQLGEYNSQISAIDAALVLIQEKQAAGIALSTQEQGILDGSTAALERLTGGTNDATLARAELAIQYAENMRVGDQLNENMKGQQEITGALIGIVRDLILALDGVPEDVKTDIRAIDNATPTIRNVRGELDGINGKVATTYVDTVHRRVDIGFTDQLYTGGTVGTIHAGSRGAAGGITVGEFGREFIPNPPHGMQVMPHGASMSRLESERKRGRRDGGMVFRGPVTFQVDTPDNYSVWRQQAIGGTRP